jgi:hypothetical protein
MVELLFEYINKIKYLMADIKKLYKDWASGWHNKASFIEIVEKDPAAKSKIIQIYKTGLVAGDINTKSSAGKLLSEDRTEERRESILANFDDNNLKNARDAAAWVWKNRISEGESAIDSLANRYTAVFNSDNINTSHETDTVITPGDIGPRPFDKRLDRLEQDYQNNELGYTARVVPFASDFAEISTTGYLISRSALENSDYKEKKTSIEAVLQKYQKMANDEFFKGVPALQNQYATVRLYGSKGGKYLINQKNERRWYEVDAESPNYTSAPTTSTIISWGNADPYGRTPYQFTDFVFSKYWNKIENNRLITLRRYAAPILDNLKFPGMTGDPNMGNSKSESPAEDTGSTNNIAFPPMASAITYFGGETGNSLTELLKFTTGVLWDDAQGAVWETNTQQVPDSRSGPGGIFGSLASFAEMLNVAGGNFDRDLIMNKGNLPPDPYVDGPYENRIMGPINRIDSVKKRKPGLAFSWEGLNLSFEYVARPIGGVNPKAVLLDIMSNFFVIGSASAVFFGGAHRFMANPEMYPFIGGEEGVEKWYRGDPIGWGLTAVKQFTQGGSDSKTGSTGSAEGAATGLLKNMEGFFNQLFSGEKGSGFGALTSLFTGAAGNIINNEIAKKSAGQIPFLSGMKAILTGEPVGEWHITIGNPLNPIAMIGNLICEGIDVEFNEELGPDDFPTEMKITVRLKHAMARDRDAIESIFNRGMGRIYNLPDTMKGGADYQTVVDPATQKPTQTGTAPNRRFGILYKTGLDSGYIPKGQIEGKPLSLGEEVSVWNRGSFNLGISEGSATQFISNQKDIFKSAYRTADWIAQRSLE